jgi:hypothetical protein
MRVRQHSEWALPRKRRERQWEGGWDVRHERSGRGGQWIREWRENERGKNNDAIGEGSKYKKEIKE